jgi:hypothetical protein
MSAPTPDLRIVMTSALFPHEETDSQRLEPLIERIRNEPYIINPPIVAPIDAERFVILDGANRCQAFARLNYPHSLVQVVSYHDGAVALENWQHVVCNWSADALLEHLTNLPDIDLRYGHHADAIAHIHCHDGRLIALHTSHRNLHDRNAALRRVVSVYQRSAILQRTALNNPEEVWALFDNGAALVVFPAYSPDDIIAAAREGAMLPPGVSRHIVQGRALKVHYSLDALRDPTQSLQQKNVALRHWLQEKIARRQMRYYAEPTYQFDE